METAMQSKEPQGNLYAVYGTLRKGFGNHRLLDNEHCELLGTVKTEPKFKMVSLGGFPGVIPDEGTQSVVVEIYRVNSKEVEKRLDWLEGYPSFYQKTEIETQWGTANMYILSEEKYGSRPIVESGDWKEYVKY
jgi:gamma-glutamylaminecyclotransferase